MLDLQIDGVSLDAQSSRRTLRRIQQLAQQTPLVYLSSHDPESVRLLEGKMVATRSPSVEPVAMLATA